QKRAMQLAEAEATQRRAVALLEQLYGPDHPHLQAALDNLGEVLALRGDHQAAVDAYQRSLKIGELRFGPTHPELDYALIGLAESALALGDLEQARRAFTRVTRDPEAEGKQQDLVAVGYFGEARLLAAEGKAQPARERAGEARALMAAQPRPDAGELERIETFYQNLQAVTPADIQAAAQRWLVQEHRIVAVLRESEAKPEAKPDPTDKKTPARSAKAGEKASN
ncbi:MAG: tetratricopeptide repeat protein, partial [Myxococcales bacterium]|nr:tetratricopeptide repeat protein [Myxococcales bacterium]